MITFQPTNRPMAAPERYEADKQARKVERRERREAKRTANLTMQTRRFVGWDGEGVTRKNGRHDYVLFANSDGERISSLSHLSTYQIFEFIDSVADPDAINVIYGAGYDWNMWLKDIRRPQLEELYSTGQVRWNKYILRWQQGKAFSITIREKGEKSRTIQFYDVFSFFQRSFVAACDEYLGSNFLPEEREMITANKMLRSGFRAEDIAEIITYNNAELKYLVMLANELRERLARVGLFPARWDGPGAIAVALFKREGIKDHLNREFPEEVLSAAQYAYFGGRFEVVRHGHSNNPVYEYDINSAYPWALQDVPSLAGGVWEHVEMPDRIEDFALYRVQWNGTGVDPTLPQPLPMRSDKGIISFPMHAHGWYWGPEVRAAKQYAGATGFYTRAGNTAGTLTIHEGYVFQPATDEKPFAFIAPLYTERKRLKAAGDGAHVGIKLGLNSMYGKLAQQVGWRRDVETGEVIIPPYHQIEWAGYTTSRCRAAILELAMSGNLRDVIAFETDAMFTTTLIPSARMGSGLGEWEYVGFRNMTYVQSGTYFADSEEGKPIDKTRGVDRGNLTRAQVLEALDLGLPSVPSRLTRFMTLGISLKQNFDNWTRWVTGAKEIQLSPNGKRKHLPGACCYKHSGREPEWHDTIPQRSTPDDFCAKHAIEWNDEDYFDDSGMALSDLRRMHYEERGSENG